LLGSLDGSSRRRHVAAPTPSAGRPVCLTLACGSSAKLLMMRGRACPRKSPARLSNDRRPAARGSPGSSAAPLRTVRSDLEPASVREVHARSTRGFGPYRDRGSCLRAGGRSRLAPSAPGQSLASATELPAPNPVRHSRSGLGQVESLPPGAVSSSRRAPASDAASSGRPPGAARRLAAREQHLTSPQETTA